jgi:L-2,4-diaminobutyric acid acetyltransferase
MNKSGLTIQTCTMADYPALRRVIDESESLDHHTDYTYWVALNQWPSLFLIAKRNERIIGFAFGLRNDGNPERLFLWQIGVVSSERRRGIATKLVNELCVRAVREGVQELWFTIADEIAPSRALFRKLASAFGSSMVEHGSTGDLGGPLHEERIYSIALPQGVR